MKRMGGKGDTKGGVITSVIELRQKYIFLEVSENRNKNRNTVFILAREQCCYLEVLLERTGKSKVTAEVITCVQIFAGKRC